MANTYPTQQFPLGSTEVKVLFNNASNFDEAMNSELPSFYDRFNKRRETWAGMQKMVADFIEAFGWEATHLVYVDGTPLTVLRPTQLIDRAGSVYKVKMPATFPVNLTGTWATDQLLLVDVGDASLRSTLASSAGSGIVGFDPSVTYPAGTVGAFLASQATLGVVNVRDYGAIPGGAPGTNGVANINALNAAFAVASAIGVGTGTPVDVLLPRSSLGPYEFGGLLTGTNKVMCKPMPYVNFIVQGQIKIADGQNTLAGALGYRFISYAEDTDPATDYFTVRGLPGNYIDGNAAGNLNLTMKSNALIAVSKGVGCGAYDVNFKNCPGYHVIQWGLNTFPFSIGPVETIGCTFTDVGETIAGNTGITDHSSVYGFTRITGKGCVGRNNGLPATICSMFEAHGDLSVIDGNEYYNFLNMVNIGGYASNAGLITISNNKCIQGHMLVRGYTNPGFSLANIQILNNQLVTGVGKFAMVDFGVATLAATVDRVDMIGNQLEFNGADHGVGYPPGVWIANVKNFRALGNRITGVLGPAYTFGNCPNDANWIIDGDTIENANSSAYANSYAAIFLENVVGRFDLMEVKNTVFTGGKSFALATTAFAAIQGDVVSFKGNTVNDLPNLINVEGTTSITRVDVMHQGRSPDVAFEVGNQWTKISVGSEWICGDVGHVMRKTVAGSTYWNKFGYGSNAPATGSHQRGDRWTNTLPSAAGFADFVCVTAGTPGIWKTASPISA